MNKKLIAAVISVTTVFAASSMNFAKVQADSSTQSTSSSVKSIAGTDYYKIGAEISQAGWSKSDAVVLASSADFPDALSGTSLAIQLNCPILFTSTSAINNDTLNEIQRLGAKKVYILGGTGSVDTSVENLLKSRGLETIRLYGQDRFETAAAVGKEVINSSKSNTAFISNAYGFADALASSTFAGESGAPILLTEKDSLNEVTKKALSDWGIKNVYMLGGTGVVSSSVENELRNMGISINRLGGADRYETAEKIVKNFDSSLDKLTLVTGKDYHNALIASVYGSKTNHPLMLIDNEASQDVKDFVKNKDIITIGDIDANLLPNETKVGDVTYTWDETKKELLGLGIQGLFEKSFASLVVGQTDLKGTYLAFNPAPGGSSAPASNDMFQFFGKSPYSSLDYDFGMLVNASADGVNTYGQQFNDATLAIGKVILPTQWAEFDKKIEEIWANPPRTIYKDNNSTDIPTVLSYDGRRIFVTHYSNGNLEILFSGKNYSGNIWDDIYNCNPDIGNMGITLDELKEYYPEFK